MGCWGFCSFASFQHSGHSGQVVVLAHVAEASRKAHKMILATRSYTVAAFLDWMPSSRFAVSSDVRSHRRQTRLRLAEQSLCSRLVAEALESSAHWGPSSSARSRASSSPSCSLVSRVHGHRQDPDDRCSDVRRGCCCPREKTSMLHPAQGPKSESAS